MTRTSSLLVCLLLVLQLQLQLLFVEGSSHRPGKFRILPVPDSSEWDTVQQHAHKTGRELPDGQHSNDGLQLQLLDQMAGLLEELRRLLPCPDSPCSRPHTRPLDQLEHTDPHISIIDHDRPL